MVPIATYRETRFERKCLFELHEDNVRLIGTLPQGKFEATVPLRMLYPQFQRLWLHSTFFYSGVFLFMISVVAVFVVAIINGHTFTRPSGILAAIAATAFIVTLANGRKVEMVLFLSDAGVAALSIARAGRETEHFEQFVGAVVEQIHKVRGKASAPTSPLPPSDSLTASPPTGPVSLQAGKPACAIPLEHLHVCPDCWAELDMREIRSGRLVQCPKCARPFRPDRRGRRREVSFAAVMIGATAVFGIVLVGFMLLYVLPLIEKGRVNKPTPLHDPFSVFAHDGPADPVPDADEEARRAVERGRTLQAHAAREKRLLKELRQTLDPEAGGPLWAAPFKAGVSATLAFSPDGETLAAIHQERAYLWEVRTGKLLRTFTGPNGVKRLAFSPDGATLATFGGNRARLWDVGTGAARKTPALEEEDVHGVAFAPSGALVSLNRSDEVRSILSFRDARSGAKIGDLLRQLHLGSHLVFAPDGRLLACQGPGLVALKDGATGNHKRVISPSRLPRPAKPRKIMDLPLCDLVNGMAFSPDSRTLALATADGFASLSLWDTGTGDLLRVCAGNGTGLGQVLFTPDGGTVIATNGDFLRQRLRFWDVATGKLLHEVTGFAPCGISGVALSPGGGLLATSGSRTIQLWDVGELRRCRHVFGLDD